jgi:dolichol-phosphate mannosyltransferase
MLRALEASGADIAIGSRYAGDSGIADWPLWRQAISRTAHIATQVALGIPYDATNALRAYRADALRRVPYRSIRGEGYSFMFEMIWLCARQGLRIVEVPVVMPFRTLGVSKISRREVARAVSALGRLTLQRLRAGGSRP